MSEPALGNVPIALLGNKIDIKGAYTDVQLTQSLGLTEQLTGKAAKPVPEGTRPMEMFMCSIVKRSGYQDAFKWLANYLP